MDERIGTFAFHSTFDCFRKWRDSSRDSVKRGFGRINALRWRDGAGKIASGSLERLFNRQERCAQHEEVPRCRRARASDPSSFNHDSPSPRPPHMPC
jgi:hypothetical protein